MAQHDEPVTVSDRPERDRYEVRIGDHVAGFATYARRPGSLVLIHTEVEPALGGRGVGSRLAAGVLDDIRARGLRVTPLCPFMAEYLRRHPEYGDLVDTG